MQRKQILVITYFHILILFSVREVIKTIFTEVKKKINSSLFLLVQMKKKTQLKHLKNNEFVLNKSKEVRYSKDSCSCPWIFYLDMEISTISVLELNHFKMQQSQSQFNDKIEET